jgi:hypothetical protein
VQLVDTRNGIFGGQRIAAVAQPLNGQIVTPIATVQAVASQGQAVVKLVIPLRLGTFRLKPAVGFEAPKNWAAQSRSSMLGTKGRRAGGIPRPNDSDLTERTESNRVVMAMAPT